MANYYYVSDGATVGSATGDAGRVATTPSTGSFAAKGASACYVSIQAALSASTPPVAGDYIMCASDHAHTYTTAQTMTTIDGMIIISVDVSNCDQYLAGAMEEVNNSGSTLDLNIYANQEAAVLILRGMTFRAEDRIQIYAVGHYVYAESCTFELIHAGSGHYFYNFGVGGIHYFYDCDIKVNHAGSAFLMKDGCKVILDKCTSSGTPSTTLTGNAGGGGLDLFCINTDLSTMIAASGQIVTGSASTWDRLCIHMRRCKLPTGFEVCPDASWALTHIDIDVAECHQDNSYYYDYYENLMGVAEISTTQYVDDGSVTYDGTNEFSIEIDTSVWCTNANPFRYKLATIPAVDLTTAKTVSVELSGPSGLTDSEVYIDVELQDATDNALGVYQRGNYNGDPLATGTALTAGTATWANTANTEYKIDEPLGAQTGVTNSNVTVYVSVAKASVSGLNVSMPTIAAT